MFSYIIFFVNLLELYVNFSDIQISIIDKNLIKDILDFIVALKYSFYASFKYISIKMHYYFLLFYTMFVFPNIPFAVVLLKHIYVIKKTVMWYIRYLKFISKRRK